MKKDIILILVLNLVISVNGFSNIVNKKTLTPTETSALFKKCYLKQKNINELSVFFSSGLLTGTILSRLLIKSKNTLLAPTPMIFVAVPIIVYIARNGMKDQCSEVKIRPNEE